MWKINLSWRDSSLLILVVKPVFFILHKKLIRGCTFIYNLDETEQIQETTLDEKTFDNQIN